MLHYLVEKYRYQVEIMQRLQGRIWMYAPGFFGKVVVKYGHYVDWGDRYGR